MHVPNEIIDKILMDCSVSDINSWEGYERMSEVTSLKKKYSSIIDACENGNLTCVKYLVSVGADIHADNDGVLRWSAQNGHLEVFWYPLELMYTLAMVGL